MTDIEKTSVKFKPYPKYKDSGIEWAQLCPATWDMLPLFAVMKERDQKNIGLQETNVLSLSYGRIIPRDVESNMGLLPESFETYQIVESGNIVLRLTDLQNDKRSLRVGYVRERGIITSAYMCLASGDKLLPDFTAYLLLGYDLLKVFYGYGGGVRQTMKFDDLKRMAILVPALSEQQAIAAFLDRETSRIAELIAKKERQIELLQEKRQALISHAVTKGLDPKAQLKDSGIEWLGMVPEGWEVIPVKRISKQVQTGCTPSTTAESYYENGTIPWYGPGSFGSDIELKTSSKQIHLSAIKDGAARLFAADSVMVVGIGATIGKVGWIAEPASSNQQITAIVPDESKVIGKYLAYQLKCCEALIRGIAPASTLAIMDQNKIGMLMIVLPPRKEQKNIIKHIDESMDSIDRLMNKIRESIEKLREYRTALISAAVTGKIDLREEG